MINEKAIDHAVQAGGVSRVHTKRIVEAYLAAATNEHAAQGVDEVANDLKPCPFCGSVDVHIDSVNDGGGWAVRCSGCFAQGHDSAAMELSSEVKLEIINAWNTRAEPDSNHGLVSSPPSGDMKSVLPKPAPEKDNV